MIDLYFDDRIDKDSRDLGADGEFILYWMCTAQRLHENPALTTAIELANAFRKPLVIYQGLSERYPFASDRHHQFILQGVLDTQAEAERLGLRYVFHLMREGDRSNRLLELASKASVVITEDFPTAPLRKVQRRLHQKIQAPLWRVDCACIVPMKLSRKVWSRAFQFRDHFQRERERRVSFEWPTIELDAERQQESVALTLFPSLRLEKDSIHSLVSDCAIDHSVPPVQDSGGQKAGYARFSDFAQRRLGNYHRHRNIPTMDAVSRLSPYFHYGMISPFRIARDVSSRIGEGPKKFVDELLIWRELAYHWCAKNSDIDSLSALPAWARDTLEAHADDPREVRSYWELMTANTDDWLWDDCQRSLLWHGELHNNLRMTWGKQFLTYTQDPQQALRFALDLNHRYALDGRDPASYGGILWCFGLFDRPFSPSSSISGTVRQRTTMQHAKRLKRQQYRDQLAEKNRQRQSHTVAIIGGGLSGLMAANILHRYGVNVIVFDKGRNVGGRMSTRMSTQDAQWIFDHGAPFFAVEDSRAEFWVRLFAHQGVVKPWNIRCEGQERTVWVGSPKMSSIAEFLAGQLPKSSVRVQTRVHSIAKENERWLVQDDVGTLAQVHDLVVTIPEPQFREIVPLEEQSDIPNVIFQETWVLLLQCESLGVTDDVIQKSGIIKAAIQEHHKPNHGGLLMPECDHWVVQATPDWSRVNLEAEKEDVEKSLIAALSQLIGREIHPRKTQVHRWRYSNISKGVLKEYWTNEREDLYLAGDCFAWGQEQTDKRLGIQRAILSGIAAAGAILRKYSATCLETEKEPVLLSQELFS